MVLPDGSAPRPNIGARLGPIGERVIERDLARFTLGTLPVRDVVAKQSIPLCSRDAGIVSASALLFCSAGSCSRRVRELREPRDRRAIGARRRSGFARRSAPRAGRSRAAPVRGRPCSPSPRALFVVVLTAPLLAPCRGGCGADVFSVRVLACGRGCRRGRAAAGAYPALALARAGPLRALKRASRTAADVFLTALLVGAQFAVASFLLITVTSWCCRSRRSRAHGSRGGRRTRSSRSTNTSALDGSRIREPRARSSCAAAGEGVTGMIGPRRGSNTNGTDVATPTTRAAALELVLNQGVGLRIFRTVFVRPVIAGRAFDREHGDYAHSSSGKKSTSAT